MLVRELRGSWECSLLSQSHLWGRHVEKLTAVDLEVFLRGHWGTLRYTEAVRQVNALIDQAWHATVRKEITVVPAITSYDPVTRQRITVDELCSWLNEVSLVRRRAVLFGLETRMPIQEIIGLTWKTLRKMHVTLPNYAVTLAAAGPRHFKIDYVFWETLPNNAVAPLFGLGENVLKVSQGMGYEALQRLYRETLPFDQKDDLERFMTDFNDTFNQSISK